MKKRIIFDLFITTRRFIYLSLGLFDFLTKRKSKIFILCYHGVSNSDWRFDISLNILEKQLIYLKQRYNPITLNDINLYLKGKKTIDKSSFAITLDDGYKDVLDAKELFKKLNIKPTLFVLSNREGANRNELENNKLFLTNEEILTLKKDGWTIGSHSATHSDLNKLTDEQIKYEIINSKEKLESSLGIPIDYFAFPKGRSNSKILELVRKAGYSLGLSMNDSIINKNTNPFLIPRIGVDKTHTFLEFKSIFSPSSIMLRKFIKTYIVI